MIRTGNGTQQEDRKVRSYVRAMVISFKSVGATSMQTRSSQREYVHPREWRGIQKETGVWVEMLRCGNNRS